MEFQLIAKDNNTQARAGLVTTDHGVIETPIFMPVGTIGSVKGVTQEQLEADVQAQIASGETAAYSGKADDAADAAEKAAESGDAAGAKRAAGEAASSADAALSTASDARKAAEEARAIAMEKARKAALAAAQIYPEVAEKRAVNE